ncbi:glycerol-3-phosphate dehydrogenase [Crenobacter luteus]|uniref:glycerol-3-phosphate dehydrogenase/oxidase n=1 Tax=Crenobacter luteus TaxID=1452487 RepID=UPI001052BFE7|nr:FAD-dependent oxidoreductase [Crenobacter luteus]TCP10742.1 glycerol-3-phosphate dehydrogenase [Crenobacter luteus]
MAAVAVVGGGVNGVMIAWTLARRGHAVTLYERDALMGATSRASSKLLHGGVRYLENGEFGLVKKALADRAWWLAHAPDPALAHPLPIVWPIYRGARRGRWLMKAGFALYDALAGAAGLGRHRWLTAAALAEGGDGLKREGLRGGYRYVDGQMDDYRLGLWAAGEAQKAGVALIEHANVERVGADGAVTLHGETRRFDAVVNAAGPWAERLLAASGLAAGVQLDTVRGSHIVLDRTLSQGYLFEVPGERRVVFVLPWQGGTLIGTTEVRQSPDESAECSADEEGYLLALYNHYFAAPATPADVVARFAGVRPLIRSAADPNRALRDYRFARHGRLLTVFGGKWTTAPSLAAEAAERLDALLAHR